MGHKINLWFWIKDWSPPHTILFHTKFIFNVILSCLWQDWVELSVVLMIAPSQDPRKFDTKKIFFYISSWANFVPLSRGNPHESTWIHMNQKRTKCPFTRIGITWTLNQDKIYFFYRFCTHMANACANAMPNIESQRNNRWRLVKIRRKNTAARPFFWPVSNKTPQTPLIIFLLSTCIRHGFYLYNCIFVPKDII